MRRMGNEEAKGVNGRGRGGNLKRAKEKRENGEGRRESRKNSGWGRNETKKTRSGQIRGI